MLEQQGLQLVGQAAVSAVRFSHPGFVLCPIEAGGGRLQTLAAFVSAHEQDADSTS